MTPVAESSSQSSREKGPLRPRHTHIHTPGTYAQDCHKYCLTNTSYLSQLSVTFILLQMWQLYVLWWTFIWMRIRSSVAPLACNAGHYSLSPHRSLPPPPPGGLGGLPLTCLFWAKTPANPLDVSCNFSMPGPLKRSVRLRDAFPLSVPTVKGKTRTVIQKVNNLFPFSFACN